MSLVLAIGLLLIPQIANAQPTTGPEVQEEATQDPAALMRQAQQLVNEQDFEMAEQVLEELIELRPTMGQAWFLLGYSRHAQGDLDGALPAHLMATEIGQGQAQVLGMYNLACVYSLKNNPDKAFEWLDRTFASGYNNLDQIAGDPDFDNIREDKRYQAYFNADEVEEEAHDDYEQATTRSTYEDYVADATNDDWTSRSPRRQLDFWLGSWDAIGAKGKKVGTNVITLREGDNILHESWTGADGTTGQSVNYYDPDAKKWRQAWVSQKGGVVHYKGNFKNGAFHYKGDNIKPDGTKVKTHCILTPLADGRIHHTIKHSADGGKTWKPAFDAHYVRQNSQAKAGAKDGKRYSGGDDDMP